jgi:hypothetical protein
MKTIEQYEAQIAQQASMIQEGLLNLEENVHVIPNVVGKDPQYVYELLKRKFDETYNEYMTTTLRNVKLLDYYTQKFDKIIAVLADSNRKIEQAKSEEGVIDVGFGEEFDETVSEVAEDLEAFLEETVDVSVKKDYLKMGLIGGGSFILMRTLGFGVVTSLIGSAAAAYMLVPEQVKESAPPSVELEVSTEAPPPEVTPV